MGPTNQDEYVTSRVSSENSLSQKGIATRSEMSQLVNPFYKGNYKMERSPQKQTPGSSENSQEYQNKMIRVHELTVKLHKEEKIRDAAVAMLADLNYGQGQHQQKHHGNVIRQLNNLNSLKSDSQHKKKVKAQFEAADREVQDIQRLLRDMGVDDDDEISSGDEDGISGSGTNFLFSEEPYFPDDDIRPSYGPQFGMMSSSAASSQIDLASTLLGTKVADGSDPAGGHTLSAEVAFGYVTVMLKALDPRDSDTYVAVDKIAELIHTIPTLKSELKLRTPWALSSEKIRTFLLDKDPVLIGLGLRVLKLFTVDLNAIQYFRKSLCLDILLVQILSKNDHDNNHQLRLHAIQLIRAILNAPSGTQELSIGIYRALVAVSEQNNDDIRHICLETLAELMVIDPERVFEAGGVKVLLQAMVNPDDDENNANETRLFSLALAMAFAGAADLPDLRGKYLRGGRDLSSLLTNFTDIQLYGFVNSSAECLMNCATVLQILLRTWVGLNCIDLKLLVECMTLPLERIQETLLKLLDRILWAPNLGPPKLQSRTSSTNARALPFQYTAILLQQLQRLGLQEKLVSLQAEGATDRVRKLAQYLGSRIFTLSARLLPKYAVVDKSLSLSSKLESDLAKAPSHSLPTASIALFGTESQLQLSIASQLSKPSLQIFIRFGVSMDDGSFKKVLNATHVLDTKLFRQWNWDALMEFVQGPLRSPKRLDEVTKGSKFLKRLLSFYRPFKFRFSNLAITKEHLKYVDVGKELMKSLLETPEGARYLAQNKLFRQIAECLAQLDPLSGIMSNEPLFSVRRFRSTLCCAYSELIGVLSHSALGQKILAQIRIFNMLYRAFEVNREDLTRSFICTLDYRLEGHPRLILAKSLTASGKSTRLFATEFVGSQLASPEPYLWAIDLMVEQLYDPELSVANSAANGLHNMCTASEQALDYLISIKPFLSHLGEPAEQLRILFMSRPQGFELLLSEFEDRDISHWAPGFNEAYVDKIDDYLESVYSSDINDSQDSESRKSEESFKFPAYAKPSKKQEIGTNAIPPSHFYGELALTEQGCRFLQSKGIISDLARQVKLAADDCKINWSPDRLLALKGALWALGNIASRPKGAVLLNMDVAMDICRICKSAQVFSIKGTAIYTLGLFALSLPGAELLHQCGWDVVYDVHDQPLGIALPPESYYSSSEATPNVFSESDLSLEVPSSHSSEKRPQLLGQDVSKAVTLESPDVAFPVINKISENSPIGKISLNNSNNPKIGSDLDISLKAPRIEISDTRKPLPNSVILPPPTPSSSLTASPRSLESIQRFDFDLDNETPNNKLTSCFDLIELPQKKGDKLELILKAIGELGSYVLSQKASKRLVEMRASHPEMFQKYEVLYDVTNIFDSGHYKQVTRRFVFELFDIPKCLERCYKSILE